jgi:hypothetical protein
MEITNAIVKSQKMHVKHLSYVILSKFKQRHVVFPKMQR